MKAALLFFASAGVVVLGACNGRVEQVLGGDPAVPDGGGGIPIAADSGGSSSPLPPPGVVEARGNECTTDADCNEEPSVSQLLGRCWKKPDSKGEPGSCLCNEGAWIQVGGKCGLTAPSPSCTKAGGSCSSWTSCSNAGNYRSGASEGCFAEGATAVCCVPSSACRLTAIPGCYRKGTDAAYSPPCINGWVTCNPGDSPDIDI